MPDCRRRKPACISTRIWSVPSCSSHVAADGAVAGGDRSGVADHHAGVLPAAGELDGVGGGPAGGELDGEFHAAAVRGSAALESCLAWRLITAGIANRGRGRRRTAIPWLTESGPVPRRSGVGPLPVVLCRLKSLEFVQ